MAIVRDVFEGAAARSRLAFITLILSIAPVIAPSLGTLILLISDWRAVYAVLAAAGGALLVATYFGLAETHVVRQPVPLHPVEIMKRYRFALANRATLGFSLVNGFSFACMFAFITASPIVFMAEFGLSQAVYSALFFTAGLGTIAGSIVSGRLKSGHWAIRAGAWIGTGCTALTVFVCLSNWSGAWTLLPLLFLSNACYGLLGPHASHDALVPMGSMAGIASAVLRSCQMLLGAVAGSVAVALAPLGPAVGMSLTMFAAALASLVSIRVARLA
jgi:DHA1 family bicyclomycin/chloramphenicol resistance-like MFS transporter